MAKRHIILAAITLSYISCAAQTTRNITHIEGRTQDYPECKTLLLFESGEDIRTSKCDTIQITDGRFSHDLITEGVPTVYEIVPLNEHRRGSFSITKFFAETGTVDITFTNDDTPRAVKSDAPLNAELRRYEEETHRLFFDRIENLSDSIDRNRLRYTPEAYALIDKMEQAASRQEADSLRALARDLEKANKMFSQAHYDMEKAWEKAFRNRIEHSLDYAENNVTPVGLYVMTETTWNKRLLDDTLISRMSGIFDRIYAKEYPHHPMSRFVRNFFAARTIKPGGRFIDFSAPDLQGNMHTISTEIAGKVALIDLWGSWCAPCRRLSKSMIPVYEEYKDRGFTIVGIARERNVDAMKKAIAKDGYPWLNLIELNDSARIWEKYGVSNSGGTTILVGRDGKILAIHPSADEVKAILDREL